MALLGVSRQIFEEAMPVFYKFNNFHAKNLHDLTCILQHCVARRRACFISIPFGQGDNAGRRVTKKAFSLLKSVKHLHNLEILIEDDPYLTPPGAAPYKSADEIPGIEFLSTIRGRELDVPCTCPTIESVLRPTMLTKDTETKDVKGKRKPRKIPRRTTKTTRDT